MSIQTIPIQAGATSVIVDTADAKVTFIVPDTVDQPPIIDAGADQTITLPNSSFLLSGTGSDPDGEIVNWRWSIESAPDDGAEVSIVSPASAITQVNVKAVAGTYIFDLEASDNEGLKSLVAKTTVTILPAPNQPPVAHAGADQTITLPTNSVTLAASGTDGDGTIAAYAWSKLSGPNGATFSSVTAATTVVSNLLQGTYSFRVTVTDDKGSTSTDDVQVTVNPQPTPPPTGYTVVYSNTISVQKDLDPFGHGQLGNGKLDTSAFVSGPASFKSRPANVSSGIRSEIQFEDAQTPLEGALEYDVRYNVIVPNNGHSLQWHPTTSGGSASPGLWFSSGKFLWNNWINGVNQGHSTGFAPVIGRWYHFRIEYKFGSTGYLRFFIDGVQNTSGSWTGQVGDGSRPYLKVGYNGWDGNSTASDINYDNIVVYKKG